MKYNRKPITGYLMALLFAGMAISCSQDQDQVLEPTPTTPDAADGNAASANRITGDTLAVVNYADGSFVGFYEFSPGEIAIRHSQLAALKPGMAKARVAVSLQIGNKLDQMSEQKQSMVEIYKAIATAPQPEVISRLAAAQVRAAEVKTKTGSEPSTDGPQLLPDNPLEKSARVAAGCGPDYYNDDYGAQWFKDNYVNEGNFREYVTNRRGMFRIHNQTWAKTCAMAPGYEAPIYFRGNRWDKEAKDWRLLWGYEIGPRRVECWYLTENTSFEVKTTPLSGCHRAHLGMCSNGKIYQVDH